MIYAFSGLVSYVIHSSAITMADDMLNLSLDDIIRKNKSDKKPVSKKDKPKGIPVGRSPKVVTVRSTKEQQQSKTDRLVKAVAQGGVAKKGRGSTKFEAARAERTVPLQRGPGPRGRDEVRGGRGAGRPDGPPRNDAARRAALDGNGKWQHDLFREVAAGQPRNNLQARLGAAAGAAGAKLFISNLDFKVSEQDITELFEVYGRLRKVQVHYDRSGRSEGTAHVIFESRGDAVRAQERYNSVALDGKPMKIEVMDVNARTGPVSGVKTLSSGIRLTEVGGAGAGGAPSRTGLQLTRTFAKATNGSARSAPGGNADNSRRPRVASRVVRGRGGMNADYMDME